MGERCAADRLGRLGLSLEGCYERDCLHAVLFEGGLLMLTLPVLMVWTGLEWWPALLADVAVALAYTVYAFLFNLGYDRLFPISGVGAAAALEK